MVGSSDTAAAEVVPAAPEVVAGKVLADVAGVAPAEEGVSLRDGRTPSR
jgi:hypothetical protein